MALSLNDVNNKRKRCSTKDSDSNLAKESDPSSEPTKVRPWQTPESVPTEVTALPEVEPESFESDFSKKPEVTDWNEWMQKAELLKNISLASLPPKMERFIKNSWIEKIQLYPKVRIPVPSIFTRKEK